MEEKNDFVTAQMSFFGADFSASGTCDKKKPEINKTGIEQHKKNKINKYFYRNRKQLY